jgi:hypothetical protein
MMTLQISDDRDLLFIRRGKWRNEYLTFAPAFTPPNEQQIAIVRYLEGRDVLKV